MPFGEDYDPAHTVILWRKSRDRKRLADLKRQCGAALDVGGRERESHVAETLGCTALYALDLAVADTVLGLISDRTLRQDTSNAGTSWARSRFGFDTIARAFETLLEG